jgi:hypothetical protein
MSLFVQVVPSTRHLKHFVPGCMNSEGRLSCYKLSTVSHDASRRPRFLLMSYNRDRYSDRDSRDTGRDDRAGDRAGDRYQDSRDRHSSSRGDSRGDRYPDSSRGGRGGSYGDSDRGGRYGGEGRDQRDAGRERDDSRAPPDTMSKERSERMNDRTTLPAATESDKSLDTVYVTGLPPTITDEKLITFFSKVGILKMDKRSNKPKIHVSLTHLPDLQGQIFGCSKR